MQSPPSWLLDPLLVLSAQSTRTCLHMKGKFLTPWGLKPIGYPHLFSQPVEAISLIGATGEPRAEWESKVDKLIGTYAKKKTIKKLGAQRYGIQVSSHLHSHSKVSSELNTHLLHFTLTGGYSHYCIFFPPPVSGSFASTLFLLWNKNKVLTA